MSDKVSKEHTVAQIRVESKVIVRRWVFSTAKAATAFVRAKNKTAKTYRFEREKVPARRGPGG